MRKSSIVAAAAVAAVLATPAFAHPGLPGHTHGFVNGLLHPVSGLDHLLAMLGVGVWSALVMKGQRVLLAPVAFVCAMLAGAVLGVNGIEIPAAEAGIAISVIAIGLFVLARVELPAALAAAVIGAFGVMHGYAHGAEATGNIAAYMAGFTITTASLHLAGIGLGRAFISRRLLTQLAGAAMTLAGISLLAL